MPYNPLTYNAFYFSIVEDELKSATEKGFAPAAFNLGTYYLEGVVVNRNYAEAAKLYSQAATAEILGLNSISAKCMRLVWEQNTASLVPIGGLGWQKRQASSMQMSSVPQ